MKRIVFGVFIATLMTGLVLAQDQDADNVRIVTTGQIIKIDSKKKTFQFRITLDEFPRGRGFGSSRGRGGRGPAPGGNPSGGDVQYIPTIEVKVFVTEKTAMKSRDAVIDFSKLRIGDRISLTGVHRDKNYEIDALQIDR